jgi:hypothetical protein
LGSRRSALDQRAEHRQEPQEPPHRQGRVIVEGLQLRGTAPSASARLGRTMPSWRG